MSTNETETRESLLNLICERFNEDVAEVASDAILDILRDAPEEVRNLLSPIALVSNFWLEQLARAACDLASDHFDDLEGVLEECLARQIEEWEPMPDMRFQDAADCYFQHQYRKGLNDLQIDQPSESRSELVCTSSGWVWRLHNVNGVLATVLPEDGSVMTALDIDDLIERENAGTTENEEGIQ